IDPARVVVEGLSRYGKAALVATAFDCRFSIGFIGSSGAGGAKPLRRDFGERLENLTSSGEYHWFAPAFLKYGGPLTVDDLPVDAHSLIALAAPRPLFIGAGNFNEDGWVDPTGSWHAAKEASAVWRLLGARGLIADAPPAINVLQADGRIAFRQHEGGHTKGPNWPSFLEFADRVWKDPATRFDPTRCTGR
ncbi:MAG: acetylxylan esterase, partial [Pseudomonadota bacterium]|nr:acetylxylan esterase [Pseudomonadota bacterium]